MSAQKALVLLLLSAFASGCGSVVNSTRETELPKYEAKMDGVPYYLPMGKVQIAGTWNKDTHGWDLKVTPIIEADMSARYLLKRHMNWLFDDDLTIGVDPNTGLLQTVNATTTDESVNAVAGVVAAAASALTFGAELGPVGSFRGEEVQEGFDEVKTNAFFTFFQTTLDFYTRSQTNYVISPDPTNQAVYGKITIWLNPGDYDPQDIEGENTNLLSKGVLVRRPIPFRLSITADVFNFNGFRKGTFELPFQIIFLPDPKHDYCLSLDRAPFVSNSTKVSLVNGVVQSFQQVRPSIVMGIIGVPKTILGALVPIPLQIRQSQENNVEAVDKTLNSQADIKKLEGQSN